MEYFIKDGHFISFEYINVHFNIPKIHFFGYLQISELQHGQLFTLSTWLDFAEDWIHDCVKRDPQNTMYDFIQTTAAPAFNHIKAKWHFKTGSTPSRPKK